MISREDIAGVILCGGEARRMAGVEKALQLLDDRPMVAHVHARLAPQVSRVLISANRSLDRYAAYSDHVLEDTTPGSGPLGGLASVLQSPRAQEKPYLFACPGDAPFLNRTIVSRLSDALDAMQEDTDIVVPHDGSRTQPLFMLMRTTVQATLAAYLERGERSVHGWLDAQRALVVDAADIAESFLNINTTQELSSAQRCSDHVSSLQPDQEPL